MKKGIILTYFQFQFSRHPSRQRSTGSAAAILHRKNSRNSLSSNSSVSSQTTEDGTSKSGFDSSGSKSGFSGFDSSGSGSSNSVNCRRYSNTTMSMINSRNNNSQPIHHRHPSIVADVISNNPGNGNYFINFYSFSFWHKSVQQI